MIKDQAKGTGFVARLSGTLELEVKTHNTNNFACDSSSEAMMDPSLIIITCILSLSAALNR